MPSSARRTRSPMELTDRERDVVALVVRGLTNREVAGELYVGEKTVEYHLGNVYAKLGVSSRSELRRHLAN
jgi:DNA-binding CsgD family transcriptional regulator